MAENATASGSNLITVIGGTNTPLDPLIGGTNTALEPEESMAVDEAEGSGLDDLLEQQQKEMEAEKTSMEALCKKVQEVEHLKRMGTYKRPQRLAPGTPRWTRRNEERNRDQRQDIMRPNLATIYKNTRRQSSTGSSSSSRSSGSSRRGGDELDLGDLYDQVKVVRLERDNQDLRNVVQTLKDKREEDAQERRRGEESLTNTIQRLFSEMEWMSRDRTELSSKLIKAEQALQHVKEDRDQLSDENRKLKKD